MSDEANPKPRKRTKRIKLGPVIELANAGNPKAIRALRRAMNQDPKIWQEAGDLAHLAQQQLVAIITRDNKFARNALERKLADLQQELAGLDPSPAMRLSAERVVACWLQLHYLDFLAPGGVDNGAPRANAIAKRQSEAHRRYSQALKALETLRRLKPVVATPDAPRKNVRVYPATDEGNVRRTGTG